MIIRYNDWKLLDSGQSHKAIMNMLGVSRTFIWHGQNYKEAGEGRKRSMRTPRLTKAVAGKILRNPARSINKMAQGYNVFARTIGRVVKADLDKLLNEATRVQRKARSKLLRKWYADNPSVVVIFSDERLFETTNKFNTKNNRILIPETSTGCRIRICDSLRGYGLQRQKSPLLRIPDSVKINKIVYLDFLKAKEFPWIQKKFGGVSVCFQQDGAPYCKDCAGLMSSQFLPLLVQGTMGSLIS
ncbi:Putative DD37D maT transposase [Caligus rogercresseyi]|uniref:DD37D maT transposase n=1 Tax=Caligus rogercresseyi TaxID=217165 RepID=A0A7T8HG84_CALRO|nr:Putative DD37D maT transposase [Caligus rogercresseyi]